MITDLRLAHYSHVETGVAELESGSRQSLECVLGPAIDLSMRGRRRQLICISHRVKLATGGVTGFAFYYEGGVQMEAVKKNEVMRGY